MKLISLDKQLIQISDKITEEQFKNTLMTKDQLELGVRTELYRQLSTHLMQKLPIKSEFDKDRREYEWRGSGYLLTENEMYNLMLEIIDLDPIDRERLRESCHKFLNLK